MYEIFAQLCKKHGVTPYRVSKETGVPQPTLSEWKKGTYQPKQDKLQKIADYFGVSLSYLMGITEKTEAQKESPDLEKTEADDDDFVVLARHMQKIPEKERQRIIKNFRETVDMYLDAMGITDEKEGK